MYNFFYAISLPPSVEMTTIAHSTKKMPVIGTETMRQKPDLIALTSLNWSLMMKTSVTSKLRTIRTTCIQPSKKPLSVSLSPTGQCSWYEGVLLAYAIAIASSELIASSLEIWMKFGSSKNCLTLANLIRPLSSVSKILRMSWAVSR